MRRTSRHGLGGRLGDINNHLVGSDPDLLREQTFDAAINALLTGVATLAHTSHESTRNARTSEESNPKPGEAPET